MKQPFVMVAPNGARRGKADHPALPVTMDDILSTASACFEAGADGLHLHVRDDEGLHSLDAGRYRETLDALAQVVPEMRLQITTESGGRFDVAQQLQCLRDVKPGWASVSVREMARSPELADAVYGTMAENGTEVQHILYDPRDAELLRQWQAEGIVRTDQTSVIFVLGKYTPRVAAVPEDLNAHLAGHEASAPWMVCAFGLHEHACLIEAARKGGNLRVGFENNLDDNDDGLFADNAQSVTHLMNSLKRIAA
nr:3-keto-5-aminohexanoate cleavage protein [Roseovarius sp. EL26]